MTSQDLSLTCGSVVRAPRRHIRLRRRGPTGLVFLNTDTYTELPSIITPALPSFPPPPPSPS